MTTIKEQLTETLTNVKAEKELPYGNCYDMGVQACAGQSVDNIKMDADSRVVCDLCDMVGGNVVSLSRVSLDDAGSMLINAFGDDASPPMRPVMCQSRRPSVDSVFKRPLSPIQIIPRQISALSLGSLDPLFNDLDASVYPEVHEAELSEEDLFESIAVPSLGRSISSSWQAQGLGTPRSSGFSMTSAARATFGTTPSPVAVYSDENIDCNTTASAYPSTSKNRKENLGAEHCAAWTGIFKNRAMDDLDFLELDFFDDDNEGDLSSDTIATKCVAAASRSPESTRAPLRATVAKSTPIKALPRPPPTFPPTLVSVKTASTVATTKVMSNFNADGKLIPLTEEQVAKQRNWVNKRKRIKYGTKYVYTTKQNIARARKRKDGKFEPRTSDAIRVRVQKGPKGQRQWQSKRQRQ